MDWATRLPLAAVMNAGGHHAEPPAVGEPHLGCPQRAPPYLGVTRHQEEILVPFSERELFGDPQVPAPDGQGLFDFEPFAPAERAPRFDPSARAFPRMLAKVLSIDAALAR